MAVHPSYALKAPVAAQVQRRARRRVRIEHRDLVTFGSELPRDLGECSCGGGPPCDKARMCSGGSC